MKKTQLTYADLLESIKLQQPPQDSFTVRDIARDLSISYNNAQGVVQRQLRFGKIKCVGKFPNVTGGGLTNYFIVVQPEDAK